MSAQTLRWALAFVATAAIAAAITASAASAPARDESVPARDPAALGAVELELILHKIREGDLLAIKKDMEGAGRAWAQARRQGEGLWPIHEGLGDSYARAKLVEPALREYRIAGELATRPTSKLEIAAKRAATLASAGRSMEALEAYLDLQPLEVFSGRILGLAMEGDRAAAVKLIELRAETRDPRLFKIVAGLLRNMERPADAAEALAKLSLHEPWNEAQNRQAIQDLRAAMRTDRAVEVARAWARSLPDAIEAYEQMGDALWEAGRKDEALVAYSSIVDVRPADAAARARLAGIYSRRERPELAEAQVEAGLKLAPNDEALRQQVVVAVRGRLERAQRDGKGAEAVELRRRLGRMRVLDGGLFDVKVVMTWDGKSDVDLDVLEPDGTLVNHRQQRSGSGSIYVTDNTTGFGPETYALGAAKPGTYRIGAHLHSGGASTVTFTVTVREGTPAEERWEGSLKLERAGEAPVYVRDIVIP